MVPYASPRHSRRSVLMAGNRKLGCIPTFKEGGRMNSIPYRMNVRDIYEEISEISDKLHGTIPSTDYRNDLIRRLYALVLELQRRFQA